MSRGPDDHHELRELLGALRDGSIEPGAMARLDQLLADDSSARDYYVDYVELCATLRHYQGASGEPIGLASRPSSPRGRRRLAPALVGLAAAGAIALTFSIANGLRAGRPAAGPGTAPAVLAPARSSHVGYLAALTRTINPVWGPTELPTEPGSALRPGRLQLVSGLIQLEFYGGAIVVLEGPADFELIASDRAFCRRGRVRVRAPLKPSRFSIGTPTTDVVDLGTEFGVLVGSGGDSEVQVFEGSVQLRGDARDPDGGRLLGAGEGLRLPVEGASQRAPADSNAFIGAREMLQRASTEAGRRYRSWLEFSRQLQADPRVLAYYSFEGQQPWERTLLDRSTRAGARRHGGIVGCEWDEGRWPGKAALDFRRTSDRVRVDIPGEFDALTLMTWVRVDDFDHRLNALFLADGWEVPGELHWELDGRGRLIFALKGGARCDSPVVLSDDDLGIWTHLATVYAPKRRSLTHYVNGREAGYATIPEASRARIGWANVGNWSNPPPAERPEDVVRNLNGRIDEFILFDADLDAREVHAIYEAGRPIP